MNAIQPVRFAGALLVCVLLSAGCSRPAPEHGLEFILGVRTNQSGQAIAGPQILNQAQGVLRKRLDRLQINSLVAPAGEGQISVKIEQPKSGDLAVVRDILTRGGLFEVRLVHGMSAALAGKATTEPGYEWLHQRQRAPGGGTFETAFLVKIDPERGLTGKFIKNAAATRHAVTDQPEIAIKFDGEGTQLFSAITRELIPVAGKTYQLALVLDGEVLSSPRVIQPIDGGRIVINRGFTMAETVEMSEAMNNPIDAPLRIIEEKTF